jgi:PAS domain S-box-containing protein
MRARDIMSRLKIQREAIPKNAKCIDVDEDIFDIDNGDVIPDQMIYVRDGQGEFMGQISGKLVQYLHAAAKRTLLNSVLNNIEDAVIAIDVEGRICFVNQAYSETLGIPIRKIIGRLMQEIEPNALILEILKKPQVTIKPRQYIESLRCYVSVRIFPIYERDKLEAIVSIFTDATEIMLLNEEVERAKWHIFSKKPMPVSKSKS